MNGKASEVSDFLVAHESFFSHRYSRGFYLAQPKVAGSAFCIAQKADPASSQNHLRKNPVVFRCRSNNSEKQPDSFGKD